MTREPLVLLESYATGSDAAASYAFTGLIEEIRATTPAEVDPALELVAAAVDRGFHAAGFVAYEAAPGLNPELTTHPSGELPLLWFGVFRSRLPVAPGGLTAEEALNRTATTAWQSSLDRSQHAAAIATIREYIAAGDTYQVNFTQRLTFRLEGSPLACYHAFSRSQRARYSAFIDLGHRQILSASPELFFRLDGDTLTTRPMKGTARRGRWPAEDDAARLALTTSAKERAENLMIVDLLRNDMGMVAETGSVRVESLFDVETLPTVHQLTSTISARLKSGVTLSGLFRALFPCGSVTGAPKCRTMEIITELEDSPRGIYTGCIGYVSPVAASENSISDVCQSGEEGATQAYRKVRRGSDNEANAGRRSKANSYEAVFSVAIRTAIIDSATGGGVLGAGSGITWDSLAAAEYDECLDKARFAREPLPEFRLLESLLFESGTGYFLLERHLKRLAASAAYFAVPFDRTGARDRLFALGASLRDTYKVRLLLARDGALEVEAAPVHLLPSAPPLAVTFASGAVDSADPFLYHKTTWRPRYADELARHPDCADVIFCNERGEVTEGASNNLVVRINDALVTPPLHCGLLPGVFREELLENGAIREQVVSREELAAAGEIYLINSVRSWRRVRII